MTMQTTRWTGWPTTRATKEETREEAAGEHTEEEATPEKTTVDSAGAARATMTGDTAPPPVSHVTIVTGRDTSPARQPANRSPKGEANPEEEPIEGEEDETTTEEAEAKVAGL